MHLYNLTIQRATCITHVVHGNFTGTSTSSGTRQQAELVVAHGKSIELLRCDQHTGRLHSILSCEVFGLIRSMLAFRLTGASKDYLVLGSDSGRISILEFNANKQIFEKVHLETFGRSGLRRIVPGQYLACDPKGRAIMIAAVEKQKFVYIMNRDAQARLTISSPLEAHHNACICHFITGVDVGFENPIFAALETDYEALEEPATEGASAGADEELGSAAPLEKMRGQQQLTFYELDLGLNHVVRKYSETLETPANYIISVPGGSEGPSGVIVCCENVLIYKNFGDQPDIRCPIPRRRNELDEPDRGVLIAAAAVHRTKSMYLILAQSEQGDLFRVALETEEDMVTAIKLKYFDTVPVANSLGILKTGFLFVASEFGAHYLYQIAHLGDADDEPEFSSAMPLEPGDTFYFAPRPLKNLVQVDELDSLAPILHCQVSRAPASTASETAEGDPLAEAPVIYAACGRSSRGQLRTLRFGLEVAEMAVSELPGSPNAVWTVKRKAKEDFDAYIVVSFLNATLVLSIGETVEEVSDSGFLGTTPTLACGQMGEDALVQIYADGIRHIRADRRINEWKTPGGGRKQIVRCAINERQIVIALSGGELVYFEMDPSGQLNEYTERREMQHEVICMSLGRVPSGQLRSRYVAVGLTDSTVRILCLDPDECLQSLSMQALPALPESLCIMELGSRATGAGGGASKAAEKDSGEEGEQAQSAAISGMYLFIGLLNGVLLRTVLDSVTGDLSDTRTRYLGAKAAKLFRISIQSSDAVLALSSRTWLQYTYQGRHQLGSLSYEPLEYASGFASEQCPEGIVAIASNTLRILALERIGNVFNSSVIPLEQTPRRFVVHPARQLVYAIEADHRAYTAETKEIRRKHLAEEMQKQAENEEERALAQEMANAFLSEQLEEKQFGQARAAEACWASLIRVLDPLRKNVLQTVRLMQNDVAHCMCMLKAESATSNEEEFVLVVGGASDLQLRPLSTPNGGFLECYRVLDEGRRLELLHRTDCEGLPTSLAAFPSQGPGKLLVAIGPSLRLYQLGVKKLLKKTEIKAAGTSNVATQIVNIETMGDRIFVGDMQESVYCLRYKPNANFNQLLVFAEDVGPKWVTASALLDYDTMAVADKFGNVLVLRVPPGTDPEAFEARLSDPSGTKAIWDRANATKLETLAAFHVGELVTCLRKTSLSALAGVASLAASSGALEGECLLYSTIAGSIGVLIPLRTKDERDFYQTLELHLRAENLSLVGRDHLHFRSSYFPCKGIVDGDLCEQYSSLDPSRQRTIALELERSPSDILKKLDEIRARIAV